MQTVVDGLENSSLNQTTQKENFMKNARRFSSRETLDLKTTNKHLLAHFQTKLNRNVEYFL